MAQNAVTILMQTGLDKAVDAGAYPNFAIKYYLPIYDSRIDELIHSPVGTTGSTSAFAAIETSASVASSVDATVLPSAIEGQLLWKLPSTHNYQFDDTSDYQYSNTSGQSGTTLSSPTQYIKNSKANTIKEISGGAISGIQENDMHSYKGSNVTGGSGTFLSSVNFVESTPYETNTTWDKTKLFDGVNYKGASEDDSTVGVYSAEILNTIPGDFKFNKLLVFIQKLNANGTEDSSNPIPFAMLTLSSTAVRTQSINASAAGISSFEAFFKMKFTATADAQMFVQDDQVWSLSVGSSAYGSNLSASINKDIYVLPTSGSDYDATPLAKCHIIAEPGKPILRGGRSKYSTHKGFLLDLQDEHLLLYNEQDLNSSTILSDLTMTDSTLVKRNVLKTADIVGQVEDSFILNSGSTSNLIGRSTLIGKDTSATNVYDSFIIGDNIKVDNVNTSTIHAKNTLIDYTDLSFVSCNNLSGEDYTVTSTASAIFGSVGTNSFTNTATYVNNSFVSLKSGFEEFVRVTNSSLIGRIYTVSGGNEIVSSNVITDANNGLFISINDSYNITRYLDIIGENNNINNSTVLTEYDRYINIRGKLNHITGAKITILGDSNEAVISNGDANAANIHNVFIAGDTNILNGSYNTDINILGSDNEIVTSTNILTAGDNNNLISSYLAYVIGDSNYNRFIDSSVIIGQNNSHNVSVGIIKSAYSVGEDNTIANVNALNNTTTIHEHLYNIGDNNRIDVDASTASPHKYDDIYNLGTDNASTNGSNTINIGIANTMTGTVGTSAHYNNQNIGFGNTILNSNASNNIGHYSYINNSIEITSVGKDNVINDASKIAVFGSNNTVSGDHSAYGPTTIIGNHITFAEGTQTEPTSFSTYDNKTVFGGANNPAAGTNFVDSVAFWVGERDNTSRLVINIDNLSLEKVAFGAATPGTPKGEVYLRQVAASGLGSNDYNLCVHVVS